MGPGEIGALIPIVALIVGGAIAIFRPLAKAEERKHASAIPSEVSARLERMEQSIEAIALEIERITEGQRFTTKLLSERVPLSSPGAIAAGPDAPGAVPPGERRS